MGRTLAVYTTALGEDGRMVTFPAGAVVSDKVAEGITNPKAWAEAFEPEPDADADAEVDMIDDRVEPQPAASEDVSKRGFFGRAPSKSQK